MRRLFLLSLCLCVGCSESSSPTNATNPSPENKECGQFLRNDAENELLSIIVAANVVVENNEPDPFADAFECPEDYDCSPPSPYTYSSDMCAGVVLHPNWVLMRSACLPSKPIFGSKMSLRTRKINHVSQFKLIEQGAFTLIRLLEPIEYRGYFFGARLMKSKPAEGLSMYATHVVERSGHYQREDQVQYESPALIRPAQQMTCEHNSSIAAFDTVAESPVVMGLASPDSNQYQLVSSDLDWIVKTLASHDIACSTHNMMYNPEVEYIQCF